MTKVSPESILAVAPGVEGRRFGEELLLLDAQSTHLSGLNDTAAQFWELLDSAHSVQELVEHLRGTLDGPSPNVLEDTVCFFGTLAGAALVKPVLRHSPPEDLAPTQRRTTQRYTAPRVAWTRELVALADVTPPPCFPPDSEHCVG